VANTLFCGSTYGLDRGFGHYEDDPINAAEVVRASSLGWLLFRAGGKVLDVVLPLMGRPPRHALELTYHRKEASEINRAALDCIAAQRGRPFFAFVNYFDAHDPYLMPPGAVADGDTPQTLDEIQRLRDWVGHVPKPVSPEELRAARAAYEQCLRHLDAELGRLIEALRGRGLLDNTLVVVTSDHGEHFGEHSLDGLPVVGHRRSVYQPEIHVPLVMRKPGRIPAGVEVSGPVSLRDVGATILDLLGIDASELGGASLAGAWAGQPAGASPAMAEFGSRRDLPMGERYQGGAPGVMRVVVEGGTAFHRDGDGREEFYDLAADPIERRRLPPSALEAAERNRLRGVLDDPQPGRSRVRPMWAPEVE
jgi:arylsulfatase A-like enzyme